MALRVTVIAHSLARKNVEPIISMLEEAAPETVDLRILPTTGPRTGITLTRDHIRDTDMFIAIGGDGTVSEVVTGLHESSVPLAIIPAGSTNIIAREHGIPTSTAKAVKLAFGKHDIASLDLGYCNDRPFIHMAGMGLDSYMFEFSDSKLKKRLGSIAYFPAATRALLQGPQHYMITADEMELECDSPLILVANGRSVLSPRIRLHPEIVSDDGYLDLLIFKATTPLAVCRTLSRFLIRSLEKSPYFTHIRTQRAEIESTHPVPVEVDGDVITTTPATFSIKPGGVKLVVPLDKR